MKRFAFVDWELVRSTPLRHTYRCGWRELIGGGRHHAAGRSLRRHVTIEWDGKNQLIVRVGKLWRSSSRWTHQELRSISFGIRELDAHEPATSPSLGWLWFVQLHGSRAGAGSNAILAELLVAYQRDPPSTSRASVPARVKELLTFLEHCTGHRGHGPVLVTNETARKRILSHVDET